MHVCAFFCHTHARDPHPAPGVIVLCPRTLFVHSCVGERSGDDEGSVEDRQ